MKRKPDYAALIQEYEAGGMKQREFCSRNKIKYSTFQFWRARLRKEKLNQNSFLPVRVVEEKGPAHRFLAVEIHYPDGTILKLGDGAPGFVRQFLPAFQL